MTKTAVKPTCPRCGKAVDFPEAITACPYCQLALRRVGDGYAKMTLCEVGPSERAQLDAVVAKCRAAGLVTEPNPCPHCGRGDPE